jgi:pimeloyl-ACP methyl ester carboxylesterase
MKTKTCYSFFLLYLFYSFILEAQSDGNKVKIPYGDNPSAGSYFQSGDAKLYYEVYGKGDPILMLHGGVYGYIDEFEPFITKLAETHQVICLATRAHGKSEIGHEPFTYKQRAEDAYNLLKHLKVGKAKVLGFSDGGYSAYKLAALHPEVVERLVVIGAGDMQKAKREQFNYSEETLMKESTEYFKNRKKIMAEPTRWDESLKMMNDLYNKDFISSETLSLIKSPTLIMAGDADGYSNVESIVSASRLVKDAKLSVIPGCGHVVFYCNFPAVWESMRKFINEKGK